MSQDNPHKLPSPVLSKRLTALRWKLRIARSSAAGYRDKAALQDAAIAELEARVKTLADEVEAESPGALARMHDVSRGAS